MTDSQQLSSVDGLITIQDFIRWSYSCFNNARLFYGHGTDNSWDEGVGLVLQALSLPWDFDQNLMKCHLTEYERQHLHQLIMRRIHERIPVAYLVKQAWFCNLPFYIDTRVLIPRSPIAELIDKAFQPWLDDDEPDRILDLCTGSGCIGIACAYEFEQAEVDLVDCSTEALEVATKNIDKHDLHERVHVVNSDLFSALEGRKYELIVTNPPYVDAVDLATMPPEFSHEPRLGLAAGQDGLRIVKRILAQAANFLTKDGLLVVEVGNSQKALIEQFEQVPFTWMEFERGGTGVFILTACQCREYQSFFAD